MIPVFEPDLGEAEVAAVTEALRRGEISGSFGESIPAFEAAFAEYCGCRYAVAVSSGTSALHVAVAAAGLTFGDEVLVSASTNIATALGAYHNGAIPVPVDSEPETWNLDLGLVEALLTPRTKAIIPVHLFGHPVDMDALMEIAGRHQLVVIEDAAEAHGAEVRGRRIGGFGHMSCFSFYANKIITTGEGGMVTTNDPSLAERLRLLRNLGFTSPRFRHEVAGYNFRMTGLQAAMGLAQLQRINSIIEAKRRLASSYEQLLRDVPGIELPRQAEWAKHVYWMYGIRVREESGTTRDALASHLRAAGIDTRTFFCPMNLQPCFAQLDRCASIAAPVAEQLWRDGLYLPSSTTLSLQQIRDIAEGVRSFVEVAHA